MGGRLAGKTALITSAAQGIGRGVALRAAAEGAAVMLVDRADFVADVAHEAGRAARATKSCVPTSTSAASRASSDARA